MLFVANKANCQTKRLPAPKENPNTTVVAAPVQPIPDSEKVFSKVDYEARFPGDKTAWDDYVKQNLNESIPKANGAPAGTYTVMVRFIVHRNGDISDAEAKSHVGYGMEKEAVRIIKNGPRWIP